MICILVKHYYFHNNNWYHVMLSSENPYWSNHITQVIQIIDNQAIWVKGSPRDDSNVVSADDLLLIKIQAIPEELS